MPKGTSWRLIEDWFLHLRVLVLLGVFEKMFTHVWTSFKGSTGETSERRGGAHTGFSQRIAAILNWKELKCVSFIKFFNHTIFDFRIPPLSYYWCWEQAWAYDVLLSLGIKGCGIDLQTTCVLSTTNHKHRWVELFNNQRCYRQSKRRNIRIHDCELKTDEEKLWTQETPVFH